MRRARTTVADLTLWMVLFAPVAARGQAPWGARPPAFRSYSYRDPSRSAGGRWYAPGTLWRYRDSTGGWRYFTVAPPPLSNLWGRPPRPGPAAGGRGGTGGAIPMDGSGRGVPMIKPWVPSLSG